MTKGQQIFEVSIWEGKAIVLGTPAEDDEQHNCDAMGCSSIGHHVLWRGPPDYSGPSHQTTAGEAK